MTLPERPKLSRGVRAFRVRDKWVLRKGLATHPVEGPVNELVSDLLPLLDGRSIRDLVLGTRFGFAVLHALSDFEAKGLLEDAPSRERIVPPQSARLTGRRYAVTGSAAAVVLDHIQAMGGSARLVQDVSEAKEEELLVAELGPNLAEIERTNERALREGRTFRTIYPMTLDVFVSPRWGRGACFRCFELRWLAIREWVEHERAFFQYLREGGWRLDAEEMPAQVWVPAALSALRDGAQGLKIVHLPTGEVTTHEVVGHGDCPNCAPETMGAQALGWSDEPLPLGTLRQRLVRFVDPKTGVVALEETPPERRPEQPGLPHIALTRFSFPKPDEVLGRQTNFTHGSDVEVSSAETIAIVEALERYVGLSRPRGVLRATLNNLGSRAIDPVNLPLFSERQYALPEFPYRRFDPGEPIDWVRGEWVPSGEEVYVPAAAVHYGETSDLLTETSSGVAAHSARSAALLNALSELIERDAFFIHWLNRISPPLVDLGASMDPYVTRMRSFVESKGWVLQVAELTTDLEIPAYLAMGLREDGKGHPLLIGAGASISGGLALRRALKELYSAVVCQPVDWTPGERLLPTDVKRAKQHIDFYAHPDNAEHARFLFGSTQTVQPPNASGEERLTAVLQSLAKAGHQVIAVDLNVPELTGVGLYVVRAIVPGLQPLAFGNSATRLGGRRLFDAPVRMGRRRVASLETELNFLPHCFP